MFKVGLYSNLLELIIYMNKLELKLSFSQSANKLKKVVQDFIYI